MEIVIKIPEKEYEVILNNNYVAICACPHLLSEAIKNGTPLPKGHGQLRILSEDLIERELTPLSFSCQNWISEVGLSNATIANIEADKEDRE